MNKKRLILYVGADMNQKNIIRIGALSGFLAVALGAFGAHALKPDLIEMGTLATWETGAQYHLVHSLAALLPWSLADKARASIAFLIGILIFSGSLYLLSITGLKWLGAVTPFGGVAFLCGWFFLFIDASKHNSESKNTAS